MVSRSPLHGDSDRAQLLLAGSILIAVLLVGITVLLNSVVFTENVSGGNSLEATGDVDEFDTEARRNARALTIRINHGSTFTSPEDIQDLLRQNLSSYSDTLTESYADTGSTYVNLSFDETRENGTRVVQTEDASFERYDGTDTNADWNLTDETAELGWFLLNLNASTVSTSTPLRFGVRNATGSIYTLSVKRDVGNSILLNTSIDGGPSRNESCTPSGGRLLLDVVSGSSQTSDCAVNATASIGSTVDNIRVENGDAATGKLSLVVNKTSLATVPDSCSGLVHPCESSVLWKIGFTSTYRTSTMTYQNEQNVTVYDTP